MSILCNSSRLINSSPPTFGYPFTLGIWFRFTSTAVNMDVFSYGNTGSSTDFFLLYTEAGGTLRFDGGVTMNIGTVTTNVWYFALCRGISATNRRAALLRADAGAANVHAQSTTSATPTGMNRMCLGGHVESGIDRSLMIGNIAEFWIAENDVQADGGQVNDEMLRQFAFQGPFSVPNPSLNLIEYHGLRNSLDMESGDDTYWGRRTKSTWAKTGTVVLAPHPPLIEPYQRARRSQLIVPF